MEGLEPPTDRLSTCRLCQLGYILVEWVRADSNGHHALIWSFHRASAGRTAVVLRTRAIGSGLLRASHQNCVHHTQESNLLPSDS